MKCINPIKVKEQYYNCGHCINCRINYTQMWSLRLMYELSTTSDASFLTLTYNNENYPADGSLNKKDLQDFWKRLRINLQREYHEFAPKIKYYACGEYGSKTQRCHYHAIVFGLDNYNQKHREIAAKSWTLCDSWFFDKERGRNSAMQEVTPDDINYVTGYVQKKLDGEKGREVYGDKLPPFSVCSQGLGLDFCMQNKERLITNGWTYFKGHKVSLPRYFADKLGVKKSDYIVEDVNSKELELETQEILKLFEHDMKLEGTWYPENLKMMEHRFNLWYERREFEYANQIYRDFKQKQKLKGVKL